MFTFIVLKPNYAIYIPMTTCLLIVGVVPFYRNIISFVSPKIITDRGGSVLHIIYHHFSLKFCRPTPKFRGPKSSGKTKERSNCRVKAV